MKKLVAAIALTIALPAVAQAQAAPQANAHASHAAAANRAQDHSKCMAMDHGKMAGMTMQGMNMSDHSMAGMNMQGMEHCDAKATKSADQAKPSSAPKR